MQRKPGGYRTPDLPTRVLSIISSENYQCWFQQIWSGLTGAVIVAFAARELSSATPFPGSAALLPVIGTALTATSR